MYSLDFRMKVLEIKKQDQLSFMNVAKRFGVGVASVFRWSKEPTPKFSRNKPATKIDMEALKEDIKKYPDAYQYERAERMRVSQSAIWQAIRRLEVTYKKNPLSSESGSRQAFYILPQDKGL